MYQLITEEELRKLQAIRLLLEEARYGTMDTHLGERNSNGI